MEEFASCIWKKLPHVNRLKNRLLDNLVYMTYAMFNKLNNMENINWRSMKPIISKAPYEEKLEINIKVMPTQHIIKTTVINCLILELKIN